MNFFGCRTCCTSESKRLEKVFGLDAGAVQDLDAVNLRVVLCVCELDAKVIVLFFESLDH